MKCSFNLLFLPLAVISLSLTANAEEGFVRLDNGKDLTGWKGDLEFWSVQDGALTAKTTLDSRLTKEKYNTFLVWQDGQPADFELKLQYKIVGGNSGVQYRSRVIDDAKFIVSGYQADIDSSPKYTGMNYEERARAFLAQRGEKVTIGADGKKEVSGGGLTENLKFSTIAPNLRRATTMMPLMIPTGPWRAPGDNAQVFAQQGFMHELSTAAGRDHVAFLIDAVNRGVPELAPKDAKVNFSPARASAVIKLCAEKAGWGKKLPQGRGLGLAWCYSHAGHVAHDGPAGISRGEVGLTERATWFPRSAWEPTLDAPRPGWN